MVQSVHISSVTIILKTKSYKTFRSNCSILHKNRHDMKWIKKFKWYALCGEHTKINSYSLSVHVFYHRKVIFGCISIISSIILTAWYAYNRPPSYCTKLISDSNWWKLLVISNRIIKNTTTLIFKVHSVKLALSEDD